MQVDFTQRKLIETIDLPRKVQNIRMLIRTSIHEDYGND